MKVLATLSLSIFLISCAAQTTSEAPLSPLKITENLKPYVSVFSPNILLDNALVFVGDGKTPLPNYSVLISDERIAKIGPVGTITAPKGTTVIDLDGHTIMPGIVGLHNHIHMPGVRLMKYTAPRLYLAAGVTTVQTTGSADASGEIELARLIDTGDVPGPTLFPTAPYITGPGGNAVMDSPLTETEARSFVRTWAENGATWFKLYRHTDPDIAKVIIDEAHSLNLKVTGHLCSITFREAAIMGIDSIEHDFDAATDFVKDKPVGKCVRSRGSKVNLDMNGQEIADLIQTLVEENVTLTSTLAILESGFAFRPQADARALSAMSPESLERYKARQLRLIESPSLTSTPDYWSRIVKFERQFFAEGGHLVAGPDTGRHVLPGFGDQRNFELFVESGYSVSQAIQIMTHNGAKTLGVGEDIGLIKKGYQADLIIIPGDLTLDPSALKSTSIVFKKGVGFDPQKLLTDVKGKVGLPE
ncbi:MAG: amidohydrolase family protein [Robiginitomaculum sp.]|nr:amidohydrolase family protein [Robiginitomaculum sp.]